MGRLLACAGAYGVAAVVLVLLTAETAGVLRLLGLALLPLPFLAHLLAGYHIFRLFGGRCEDQRRHG